MAKPLTAGGRLTGVELDVVFAVLDFANAEIESARQVERFFRDLALRKARWNTLEGAPEAVAVFKEGQAVVKRWLGSIATKGSVSPRDERAIAEVLRRTVRVEAALDLKDGKPVLDHTYNFEGVEACCALGIALLLDRGDDRLGVCNFRKCRRFFFHAGPRPPRVGYCSTAHSNAERQYDERGRRR